MSVRGKTLFESYVARSLNDPFLVALSMASHVFNLNAEAVALRVTTLEMTEEVGPLLQALTVRRL